MIVDYSFIYMDLLKDLENVDIKNKELTIPILKKYFVGSLKPHGDLFFSRLADFLEKVDMESNTYEDFKILLFNEQYYLQEREFGLNPPYYEFENINPKPVKMEDVLNNYVKKHDCYREESKKYYMDIVEGHFKGGHECFKDTEDFNFFLNSFERDLKKVINCIDMFKVMLGINNKRWENLNTYLYQINMYRNYCIFRHSKMSKVRESYEFQKIVESVCNYHDTYEYGFSFTSIVLRSTFHAIAQCGVLDGYANSYNNIHFLRIITPNYPFNKKEMELRSEAVKRFIKIKKYKETEKSDIWLWVNIIAPHTAFIYNKKEDRV